MVRYIKNVEAVKAFRVTHPVSHKLLKAADPSNIYVDPKGGLKVYTGSPDDHRAEVGDWVIVPKDDWLQVLPDEEFRVKYTKI